MNWRNKTVLVTGAGGFIGSHLVEQLATRGAAVRAMVRYNSRGSHGFLDPLPPALRDRIEIFAGDLRSQESVRRAVHGVHTVFHLGAMVSVAYSYVDPSDYVATNVGGTLNVLNACRELRVERLIHTSSSEVYGTAVYAPIDEKHPVQAQSPYSASKIGADMLVESYVCSYEVPATIVRPFNTFGPRQSARAVIPTIITQALTGPCVRLGDLAPRRDLVYVDDTVSGLIRLAEVPETVGEVINLGTGRDYAIEELVQRVGSLVGKQLEIVFDPTRLRPRRSEVLRLQADASKARKFGWAPATALDDGLHATIQWISNSMTLYRVGAYNI